MKQQHFLAPKSHQLFVLLYQFAYLQSASDWHQIPTEQVLFSFFYGLKYQLITTHASFRPFSNLKVFNMIMRWLIPPTFPVISVTLTLVFQQLDSYISKLILHCKFFGLLPTSLWTTSGISILLLLDIVHAESPVPKFYLLVSKDNKIKTGHSFFIQIKSV